MVKKVNAVKVIDLLDRAIREKGADYVYNPEGGCFYFVRKDGKNAYSLLEGLEGVVPSCLVGYVLHYLGVTYRECGAGPFHPKIAEGVVFSKDACRALAVAQVVQDSGGNWGMAVYAARAAVNGSR